MSVFSPPDQAGREEVGECNDGAIPEESAGKRIEGLRLRSIRFLTKETATPWPLWFEMTVAEVLS